MSLPKLKLSEIKQLLELTGARDALELGVLFQSGDWAIMTDDEANEQAADLILESLWAFNADFLSWETDIDVEVFEAIQANDKCEDNNPAIRSIIEKTCGYKRFIEAAISADGRGHFISSYDGEEHEVGDYFVYRLN